MHSLLRRLGVYAGLAVAGLVLVLLVTRRPADPLDNPAYDALSKALSRRIAQDAVALGEARARVVHDTLVVRTTLVRYAATRDSLNIHDTVQVKVFVQRADSVVRACTDLVESCGAFRVRAESSLAGLTVDRDLWRTIAETRTPSRWDGVRTWAIRGAIAYGAFRLGQAAR